MKEFNKNYEDREEYQLRKQIFEKRLEQIKAHNENPTYTWKLGLNHLTDRTDAEIKSLLGLNKKILHNTKTDNAVKKPNPVDPNSILKDLPTAVDWRGKGVVTPVKDQGHCGSCWSFAATESIESMWARATGKLVELSEQNMLDCTPNPKHCGGTGGCEGATSELGFEMVKKSGIASEWTYPYKSHSGKDFTCDKTAVPFAKINNYVVLPSNEWAPLMTAVANAGPLVVSVDASAWSHYETGVFDGCNQTNPDINHAVQLVGYGTDNKLGDFWLVRNSWTPNWGERGYIRVKREKTPRCGTDLNPKDGTGCDGGPPTVTVCGTCGILYDSCYPTYNTTFPQVY